MVPKRCLTSRIIVSLEQLLHALCGWQKHIWLAEASRDAELRVTHGLAVLRHAWHF